MRKINLSHALRLSLFGLCCILLTAGCACSSENNTPDNPTNPTDPKQDNPEQKQDNPEQPKDQELRTKRVRVATWNVHNFFNTTCDSEACGGSNYEPDVTESYYKSKLSDIKTGIWTLDSDVVMLQEIETESCLLDIQDKLSTKYYPSATFGEQDRPASLDVGLLTRGTITNVNKHRANHTLTLPDGTEKLLARELLEVEITLPNGVELTAFTTHFVSKATDSVGDRRLAEAVLTQQILKDYIDAHPGRLVVFGGDLNDTPDSAPIKALEKDNVLVSAYSNMNGQNITTWNDSNTFDHIYINAGEIDHLNKTEIICNDVRATGFMKSDHCAVKTTFMY